MRSNNPKDAKLTALAADILREADENGTCDALYSAEFEEALALYVYANGFSAFLPDDAEKQLRYLRNHLAHDLPASAEDRADYILLFNARNELMLASAGSFRAARERLEKGIALSEEEEKKLRARLLSAAGAFAARNRQAWAKEILSEAENDLAYAAGRQEEMSFRLMRHAAR